MKRFNKIIVTVKCRDYKNTTSEIQLEKGLSEFWDDNHHDADFEIRRTSRLLDG